MNNFIIVEHENGGRMAIRASEIVDFRESATPGHTFIVWVRNELVKSANVNNPFDEIMGRVICAEQGEPQQECRPKVIGYTVETEDSGDE